MSKPRLRELPESYQLGDAMGVNGSEGGPRTRWVRVIVCANAVGFLAIGALALLWPHPFGSFTGGIVLTTVPAVTDFRAVYGELHLAIAGALFYFGVWVRSWLMRYGVFFAKC